MGQERWLKINTFSSCRDCSRRWIPGSKTTPEPHAAVLLWPPMKTFQVISIRLKKRCLRKGSNFKIFFLSRYKTKFSCHRKSCAEYFQRSCKLWSFLRQNLRQHCFGGEHAFCSNLWTKQSFVIFNARRGIHGATELTTSLTTLLITKSRTLCPLTEKCGA